MAGPWGAAWVGVLLMVLGSAGSAEAQQATARWAVDADPVIDLWFHGMALIGLQGPGGAPLYAPEYPSEIRTAKVEMEVGTTPLDSALPGLRATMATQEEFELLHFLPLYFPGVGRVGLLQALRAIAEAGDGPPLVQEPAAEFGATAIASIMADPAQREVLGNLADLLATEWDLFYRRYWQDRQDEFGPSVASATRTLNEKVLPAVSPFLERFGLQAGRLMPSPGIGPEGRILAGDPANPWDNQVVVGLRSAPGDSSGVTIELTARLLKETCYPAVREAMAQAGFDASDSAEGARISAHGATRCAGMVLDRYAPAYAQDHREWALATSGGGDSSRGANEFVTTFPLPPDLERALLAVVEGGF